MVGNIGENLKMECFMDMVHMFGLMELNILESFIWILNMEKESIPGQMEECLKEHGNKEWEKGWGLLCWKMAKGGKGCGNRIKGLNGWKSELYN